MSPSTDTFGIPELLLEMILEYATPQDVLLWQRVNHKWHAVIQKSTSLQEKLYFCIKPCKDQIEQHDAAWNPFTELLISRNYSPDMCCFSIGNDAFSGKANYPTASWKRMLITSPATTWMMIDKYSCNSNKWLCGKAVVCESGITIGRLAQTLEGLNVDCASYEDRRFIGFASTRNEWCICSLLKDQQACRKAANIA